MKTYQFRIYPSLKQQKRLFACFVEAKDTWNSLLSSSNAQYEKTGKGVVRNYDLQKFLSALPRNHLHSHSRQNVAKRLADSFALFFSKRKSGDKKAMPPRFKKGVYSITMPDGLNKGFWVVGNKLKVSRIGNIPIVLHRSMKGDVKTLTIKHNKAGQWYAFFTSTIVEKKRKAPNVSVGVDVGLATFAMMSDGTTIPNPRHIRHHECRIKKLQKGLSRKVKGSKNRLRQKKRLAVAWQRYDDTKKDWLHKQSLLLAKKYRVIAVEHLSITNMVKNHCVARSISDANWGTFISLLDQKAVMRQGRVIKVDAKGTSQECSTCGRIVKKDLSVRTHDCPQCGLLIDRDLNAALNIERRAGLARSHACGDHASTSNKLLVASAVGEARTIHEATP